ncbi:MAG: tryptophan synthase subunit alpha [Planctomycetota bacterium]
MNRLESNFAALRAEGRRTLVPFITAGYPSLEVTEALLKRFDALGLGVCELGIPFTDPIADGPVIQASYTEALAAGVTTGKIFEMVRRFRDAGGKLALVAMVSYSIVYRHGPEAFAKTAAEAGFDGLIIPDLPLEEAAAMEQIAASEGLSLILLVAPTTPAARRQEVAAHSRGFIYMMSVAGITGERTALPGETIEGVVELRTHTDTPICVGFGISNAETVAGVCRVADGAIVGSAIVHRITDVKDQPADAVAESVGAFVAELMEGASREA